MKLNKFVWDRLPASAVGTGPIRRYGDFLHKVARSCDVRSQHFDTFFLRNRPQLALMRRLVDQWAEGETFKVAVLGCSTGAEAYSVAWQIRLAKPGLRLRLQAVDISARAVEIGKRGEYAVNRSQVANTNICERMTNDEIARFFDREDNVANVKPELKAGMEWRVGDAADPGLAELLGPQDLVVANNFLCHMDPEMAQYCLHNIANVVKPGGYLFVSGVDLDVRTAVARELGWQALPELLEDIHYGDPCMQTFWPFNYAGLEPLDKTRPDWRLRYAAAFRLVPAAERDPANIEASKAASTFPKMETRPAEVVGSCR